MASSSNFISILSLVLVIITFASISTLGQSLTINGLPIAEVHVQGLLTCSSTGNPTAGGPNLPAVGVPLSGVCNGDTGNIFEAVTNTTGFFSSILNLAEGILFRSSTLPCTIVVQLPVTGTTCTLFPPTGTLQAAVTFIGTIENALGGLIAIFETGAFRLL